MSWHNPKSIYDRFTVTTCRRADYCNHCDTMIREGRTKVSLKSETFHKDCAEQRFGVHVDTKDLTVRPRE